MTTERMTVALPEDLASTVYDWKQRRQLHQQEVEQIRESVQRGLEDIRNGRTEPADAVFDRLRKKYQALL